MLRRSQQHTSDQVSLDQPRLPYGLLAYYLRPSMSVAHVALSMFGCCVFYEKLRTRCRSIFVFNSQTSYNQVAVSHESTTSIKRIHSIRPLKFAIVLNDFPPSVVTDTLCAGFLACVATTGVFNIVFCLHVGDGP